MRVTWSHTALSQLIEIHNFVACGSPRYAIRLVDRITARSSQIATFPESGVVVTEYQVENIREVLEGSYRILYRISEMDVTVLAVIHGARILPPTLG